MKAADRESIQGLRDHVTRWLNSFDMQGSTDYDEFVQYTSLQYHARVALGERRARAGGSKARSAKKCLDALALQSDIGSPALLSQRKIEELRNMLSRKPRKNAHDRAILNDCLGALASGENKRACHESVTREWNRIRRDELSGSQLTAGTVTDDQIRWLREHTGWKGEQCQREQSIIATALSQPSWLQFDANKREEARAWCADALNKRDDRP